MHHNGLTGLVEPMQVRHCRIEREETIERQGWRRAIELEGVVAPQLHPIGVADRRHGGKPVERAAQHDGEETRIAAFSARDLGHEGPGEQRARAKQQLAAGCGVKTRDGKPDGHDHLRWNSGAISSSVTACCLVSARFTALRVSAEASGPSAISSIALGSSRS